MAIDVLSDVLRRVRLEGALFLNGEFHEPWCIDAPRGADMAGALCPGAEELAIVHLVLEGRCFIRLHDQAPVALHAGDAAVLPHGEAHLLGGGPEHEPIDPRHAVALKLPELAPIRYGGDGAGTLLVCGWFAYEREVPNPLLAALPRLFRTPLAGRPAGPWLEQSVRYVLRDAAGGAPGSRAVAAKVAESLFVEALRGYVDALPAQERGWLAGVRDPLVGRCLALMHEGPARAWSVEALAREVHTSRSVLAERFTELVGVPPMHYLKRWRLSLAARLLCTERTSLVRVAEAVGYESEASFSRAFKAEFGIAPGAWRSGAAAKGGVASGGASAEAAARPRTRARRPQTAEMRTRARRAR